jgi:hypothetical protein
MVQETRVSGKIIFLVIASAFAAFAIILGLMASEFFEGPSPYKETSYVTIAFKNIEGKVSINGIIGVSGTNPTIIMRSSTSYQMILTVVNHDDVPHQFSIDGLGISTEILDPYGKKADVLTLSGGNEGTYTYRDALNPETVIGEFRIVKVTAMDDS